MHERLTLHGRHRHQVHETESLALKALRAKVKLQDKYYELSPTTRQAIKGMIIVAKLAASAVV